MFEGILQPMHLLLILVIAMFVFGPKRLPELGKSVGEGIRALRAGLRDAQEGSVAASRVPEGQNVAKD